VELYGQVRRAVYVEGMSRREAARRFGIDPRTVAKMLAFSVPPGYRRSRPPVPSIHPSMRPSFPACIRSESAPANSFHETASKAATRPTSATAAGGSSNSRFFSTSKAEPVSTERHQMPDTRVD
jgi:hypothetical protein